jgi:hypothetical protein
MERGWRDSVGGSASESDAWRSGVALAERVIELGASEETEASAHLTLALLHATGQYGELVRVRYHLKQLKRLQPDVTKRLMARVYAYAAAPRLIEPAVKGAVNALVDPRTWRAVRGSGDRSGPPREPRARE